jgi:hypothetical protein
VILLELTSRCLLDLVCHGEIPILGKVVHSLENVNAYCVNYKYMPWLFSTVQIFKIVG